MNYILESQRVYKLQLDSCGILDCDDVKKLGMKSQDGKIMHYFREVEDVLYDSDLKDDELLSIMDYIESDKELSDSLNDSENILFSEYVEI
jgi:hypothetical protein